MKNIVKSLLMAALMCMTFVSCRDDAEIPDHGPVLDPKEITAGVYEGTWSQRERNTTVSTTADGTISLSAGEEAYTSNIVLNCTTFNFNDKSSVCNIVPGGEGYIFSNSYEVNPMGNVFTGSISKDGKIKFNIELVVTQGRKKYTYIYDFEGYKVSQQ